MTANDVSHYRSTRSALLIVISMSVVWFKIGRINKWICLSLSFCRPRFESVAYLQSNFVLYLSLYYVKYKKTKGGRIWSLFKKTSVSIGLFEVITYLLQMTIGLYYIPAAYAVSSLLFLLPTLTSRQLLRAGKIFIEQKFRSSLSVGLVITKCVSTTPHLMDRAGREYTSCYITL